MDWKKFPMWLKIESIGFTILSLLFLILGIITINPDTGIAILIEFMLPAIGILIGLWVLSYSIFHKSWKFFLYYEGALILTWLILWILTD